MCGIVGMWGAPDEVAVRQMLGRLSHRGPDGSGVFREERGVLSHRRLAIVDLRTGTQPIHNEDRTAAIVANGEIYNHGALRDRLAARHRFRTRSDTESILHLYEELGSAVIHHLDGMFAFAIGGARGLFVARDPLGIKPLYYVARDGVFLLASELKALVGAAEGVREFPAGSWFHSDHGLQRYYTVPDAAPRTMPLAMRQRLIRETLDQAVRKRLMSDVPVGAFLSGGIDSSIIAALARRYVEDLHTFAVGLAGSRDLGAARRVARHLGTNHHEYTFTAAEVTAALPTIIYHLESFDQDLVRSAIPCYFASRLASEHVKVVLTGEGADELFAGYRYYAELSEPETLRRELRRSVQNLHNVNLQRVDRMTMAHSIEGRVPFLDLEMIQLALSIPTELKIRAEGNGGEIDKWILRKAFEDMLPREIVWRAKEQFDEGTGTVDLLEGLSERPESRGDRQSRPHTPARPWLRSNEERTYYELFADVFPDHRHMCDAVGRWSVRGPAMVRNTPISEGKP